MSSCAGSTSAPRCPGAVKPAKSSHHIVPGGHRPAHLRCLTETSEQTSKPRDTSARHRGCAWGRGRKRRGCRRRCVGLRWCRVCPLPSPGVRRGQASLGLYHVAEVPHRRTRARGDAHPSTFGSVPQRDVCPGNRPVLPRGATQGSPGSVCSRDPCFWPCAISHATS